MGGFQLVSSHISSLPFLTLGPSARLAQTHQHSTLQHSFLYLQGACFLGYGAKEWNFRQGLTPTFMTSGSVEQEKNLTHCNLEAVTDQAFRALE